MKQSPIAEKLLHYRKDKMSSLLRSLLNSPEPTKRVYLSHRNSPKDISAFETQDQTGFKQLDFSNLHEFEFRTPNLMTPHSQMSRDFKLIPFITSQRMQKNDKRIAIVQFFEENSLTFQDYVRRKDAERMIALFQMPILLSQQENLTETFSELLLFLALFMMDCQEYSKAAFFLRDCYTLSNLLRLPNYKVKCLTLLAQCAKQFKQYDTQIAFVQKALMYTWAYDYHDQEIKCYDLMGIAYFYQGNIDKADQYHSKWCSGYLEPPKSYYRVTALEFIEMFQRTLPTKATDFMSSIQGAIGIPFINSATGKPYDEKRFVKYNRCNPIEILASIPNTREFKEFNLIHHEQSQILETKKRRTAKLPKRILEITEKYHKNKDLYSFDHKITSNPRYKLPLQSQVDYRVAQSFSVEQINQNVKKFISTQREPFNKASQIYIRNSHQQKEFLPAFVARYKKLLLEILK